MKSILIAIIASIVLLQCTPGNNYTPSDLAGHWSLLKVEIIEEKQSIAKYKEATVIANELPFPVRLDNGILKPYLSGELSKRMGNLVFSGDSTFRLNYPLERGKSSIYSIESDLLKIGNDLEGTTIVLDADKGTMCIAYLDDFGLYLEETYQKVNFNDSILNILKLYDVNFPLLAGTWELIREDSYGYGEEYTLDFPYDIPDTLRITKEELISTLYTDRSYHMWTSGKKRKYFLEYDSEYLRLRPDNWYKEDDPYIHFKTIDLLK